MKIGELTDKELLNLYKKNSSEIINLFMILNVRENLEIVKELKKRGLFDNMKSKEEKEIKEVLDELDNEKVKELEEEKENLNNKIANKEKEIDYLKMSLKEYLIISSIVGAIDKGEYFRKRNYELSDKNVEELQDLYMTLIDGIFEYYKTNSLTKLDVSEILDYSVKFLDKNYKMKSKENEWEVPVEGVKNY